ncbi:hypothetical protein CAOG_05424 [Capsaspora owczarzaki ATCC 30864]|uniref:Protein RFT1 homolog n=1 Tax=Capsaspora owczarzaki (strain ATCC 30864) TaxID=595528 RepID=A0A0D2WT99_CAPO3|nr:hypothetical protein CAOG_05424 [Capsaspora owczarzaki ATCC 30864]KJE94853.1 hypothetical protein CAOG_005424 [Capsaspora owczarzaki ATCC 30864]|eukprot:XP_004346097.2 hypothetical protein CAOG_05424 [Capsaspora owczarzaki ATCC 30864]
MTGADQVFLQSAARSATYTVISQLLFRIITFVMNAIVLRRAPPELVGVVNVRLMLLYTTVLFIAREPFRRACLAARSSAAASATSSSDRDDPLSPAANARTWLRIKAVAWLCMPVGVAVAGALALVWSKLLEHPSEAISGYDQGVAMYAIAAVVELLSEPLFVRAQIFLQPGPRVVAEGLATLTRCVMVISLLLWDDSLTIAECGVAQMAYALVLLSWLIFDAARRSSGQLRAADVLPFGTGFDKATLTLAWAFFRQSILKQLLSEGERYVMTMFNVISFAEQGVFDVVNNLGSLIVRFFFLPIEDSFYPYFANCLPRATNLKQALEDERGAESRVALAVSATRMFGLLLKVMLSIAGLGLAFGPPSASVLLSWYGGQHLATGTGPLLLQVFCVYVAMLAVNGISECFVSAVAPRSHLDRMSGLLVGISVLFIVSSILLTSQVGAVGFVIANCMSVGIRLVASSSFIRRYYANTDVDLAARGDMVARPATLNKSDVVPRPLVIMALVVSCSTVSAMRWVLDQGWAGEPGLFVDGIYIATAAFCLCVVAGSVLIADRALVDAARTWYRERRAQQKRL